MFQETGYSIWETGYSIQKPGNPLVKLGTNFFNKMEVLQTPCNPSWKQVSTLGKLGTLYEKPGTPLRKPGTPFEKPETGDD